MATGPFGCHLRGILRNRAWVGFSVGQSRRASMGARMRTNGAIRSGGGSFAKREEALEEMYFKKKESELIDKLKSHHEEEIATQKKEIKRLQEKIKWHKDKLNHLEEQKSSDK